MASNLDYGLIAKALGALALGKGIKGLVKAKNVNNYAQRAGVDYDVGGFYGGDETQAINMVNALWKRGQEQKDADDLAGLYGMPSGHRLKGIESYIQNVAGPTRKMQAEYGVKNQVGQGMAQNLPALLDYIDQLQGPQAQPQPTQVVQSQGRPVGTTPGGTPLWDESTPQVLTTGARQANYANLPELPEGGYYDPELIKQLPGIGTARYNAQTQRYSADTSRMAEDRAQDLHPEVLAQKKLQAEKLRQEIARLKQMLQLNPRLFEARIAALSRSNRGGAGGGRLDKLGYLIQSGVPEEDIVNWVMNGEDTSTTTITYDNKGNPIQTRVTERGQGRTTSPANPQRNVNGIKW